MSWIKIERNLLDSEEVYELSCILKIDVYSVVGRLCAIWHWFDENSKDGTAKLCTKYKLDKTCEKSGFCDAMIKVGWLIQTDEKIIIPNYERHNSKNAKNRALSAKRMHKHREKKIAQDLEFE
ncbi:MAG: hypothetical protein PHH73_02000 [Candidatus Rickettsiella isopodorum]|nr:hypothetical protein [Candidatus Rickettsiella isopodorum]